MSNVFIQQKNWYSRWYYILKNKTTGKLYFGQTTQNPGKNYFGSGKYWTNHCKKHGGLNKENIIVVWKEWFDDKNKALVLLDEMKEKYPDYWKKENEQWANLILENCEDNPFYNGGEYQKNRIEEGNHPFCKKGTYEKRWTQEHRNKQKLITSSKNKEMWQNFTEDQKRQFISKMTSVNKGKESKRKGAKLSEEQRKYISEKTKEAMNDKKLRGHLSQKAKARCDENHSKELQKQI